MAHSTIYYTHSSTAYKHKIMIEAHFESSRLVESPRELLDHGVNAQQMKVVFWKLHEVTDALPFQPAHQMIKFSDGAASKSMIDILVREIAFDKALDMDKYMSHQELIIARQKVLMEHHLANISLSKEEVDGLFWEDPMVRRLTFLQELEKMKMNDRKAMIKLLQGPYEMMGVAVRDQQVP